ncbi:polysaccharide pyruvyl transferase family protein [Rhodococcus sp. CH91]|uniref:polysaccharide pyruvyl transferase family protein n=1 Tax=Rhodococcus sp. CH91 TaxID=2910256 RepID=UPI0035A938A5
MPNVSVVHWNPRQPVGLPFTSRRVRLGRRVNNFGDLLGPLIVSALRPRLDGRPQFSRVRRRLLAVGSILHLARDGDCVWGTGVNGKIQEFEYTFRELDVRAVRGPLTRDFLLSRGLNVEETYGDPALLTPIIFPWLEEASKQKKHKITIVPNLNDLPMIEHDERVLDPRSPLEVCLNRIAQSERVVGSSLHGIIIAEALGIPARLIKSSVEDSFKYADYYLGTGRTAFRPASSVKEAVDLGGEPPVVWDPEPLLRAFPTDLWIKGARNESR